MIFHQQSPRVVDSSLRRSLRSGLLGVFCVSTSLMAYAQTESLSPSVNSVEAQSEVSVDQPKSAPKILVSTPASVPPKVARYVSYLISRHDRNGDGLLQKEEWRELQGHPELIDVNGDGIIDRDELNHWVADYGRRKRIGVPALPPLAVPSEAAANSGESVEVMGRDSTSEVPERLPNERRRDLKFFVPAKRLPQGLPEWFLAKDLDGDGQLTTGEFSPAGLAAELEDFTHFDANGDGVLTAKECVRKSPSSK